MSDESRSRHLKYCIWGLVLCAVLLGYPLGIGPWIYLYEDLPGPVQQIVYFMYYPLDVAYASDTFRASSIGSRYIEYIEWWHELKRSPG